MASQSGVRKRHLNERPAGSISPDESAFDETRHKVFVCIFLLTGMALLGYYGFYVNNDRNASDMDLQPKLRTCIGIISKEIGRDWRKLGEALNFSENNLQEFDKETSHFTRASKMLKQWQQRGDSMTATLNNLIQALRSASKAGLAEKCENL
ncbi:hypothetical protein TrispH2_000095 [Trichoplax sp. H2]|uniref:Expressed protein n=1 Tax=Trichoplax adhaerens TaxID=10228 RepID=B3RIK7_TRIAD|nr:expressed protein [Trichoplax adhaerens]EDV29001.1 expressed protein [Trichoplax adhaerens]RDD47144.1 hypothetical protein TrispH2_000095 [Trichoplax sp. H2]|eukprot:XP_002108203.1 expressed protein [Trichoplax adhaerens]